MKLLASIGFYALSLAVVGTAVAPALRSAWASGCEPKGWIDWHLAMRRQCLEPRYVCRHMTSAELLRDPDIAAAYRQGLATGQPEPVPGLDAMVGRMRARYGCEPEPGDVAAGRAGASPHGRLAPGHPPEEGTCPFAGRGPPAGEAIPFGFQRSPTTTL